MTIDYVSFDQVPSFKGASQHILAGLRGVVERRPVRLITLGDAPLPRWKGLTHHPLPFREKNYLKRGFRFREAVHSLLSRRTELVHFRTPWEGMAVVRRGVPAIYEVNGLPSMELRYHYRSVPAAVVAEMCRWERRCIEHARLVICPSERIKRFIEERYGGVGPEIRVFPNAYDRPTTAAERTAADDAAPVRLVYLGTLSPWQGAHWSIKGIAACEGRVSLSIFSPTEKALGRYLRRRISRFGADRYITLEPPLVRAALSRRLAEFDAGFSPLLDTERNREQGCFPLKLLEYLAHGLPVIASDVEANRLVLDEGRSALLFKANVVSSLAAVLRSVADDRSVLDRLRGDVHRTLARHWTWDEYGAALSDLYATFASSSPTSSW